jgi:signal transduction histidine kinase
LHKRYGLNWLQRRWLEAFSHAPPSGEYRAWQQQFLSDRLRLGIWIALLCSITFSLINLYKLVLYPQANIAQQSIQILGDEALYKEFTQLIILSDWVSIALLLVSFIVLLTPWGTRHPNTMFLAISWSLTLPVVILGTFMAFPAPINWNFIFMALVILVPVNWRLHLLSQSVSVVYYFVANFILGTHKIPTLSDMFDLESILSAAWICIICDVAVYTFDRLKQREFESRRELSLFLHAVTHDLRTPVLGTSMVLQSLLRKARSTNGQGIITAPKLEQLLAGSDRQLHLIDSILEAHTSETQRLQLHCKPLQLSTLVDAILSDSAVLLAQNQIHLTNRIAHDLPLVQADADQLWRVFSNLINNALVHNPSGIHLTLDATVLKATVQTPQYLRCTFQDSGIGIPLEQQQRLFDLYYRGSHSRYMPGLGLGLYLCRQIITAHGGQLGVISRPGAGSTFWFTLPVASVCSGF